MPSSLARLAASLAFALTALPATAILISPAPVMAAQLADSGQFHGADRSHLASGGVSIVRLKGGGLGIKLAGDFDVRGGPDLRVWLSEADAPRNARAVRAQEYVDLGRLRSSSGEQIYRIPDDVSLRQIGSVVIWCRAFGVFFGHASLG